MAIEVFWGSGSGPAWRVLLACVVKGVPYDSRLISFSTREHKTPEYLAMNPRGKVPALRDGDVALNESLAILAYLDKKHPEPPLFGDTPEETGQVWRWCLEHENHVNSALGAVTRPILFGGLPDKADEVRAAIPAMHAELVTWEDRLAATGFLVGDRLSAADLVLFCAVQSLVRAASRPAAQALDLGVLPLAERFPNLLALARKIEALPGYEATFPPHWLTSDPPSPHPLT